LELSHFSHCPHPKVAHFLRSLRIVRRDFGQVLKKLLACQCLAGGFILLRRKLLLLHPKTLPLHALLPVLGAALRQHVANGLARNEPRRDS
jgi:hypothetical protein